MNNKKNKSIKVGNFDKNARETYNFYNPDTKRVIMIRYIKCEEWKITEPV